MIQKVFKALANKNRRKLFQYLLEDEICVCELSELFEMSQPAVSQHLRTLQEAGLVTSWKRGYWTYYRADTEPLTEVVQDFISGETLSDKDEHRLQEVKNMNLCERAREENNEVSDTSSCCKLGVSEKGGVKT